LNRKEEGHPREEEAFEGGLEGAALVAAVFVVAVQPLQLGREGGREGRETDFEGGREGGREGGPTRQKCSRAATKK